MNDHQRGRDLIGLAHRTNFYPDRKLPLDAIKPFLLYFINFSSGFSSFLSSHSIATFGHWLPLAAFYKFTDSVNRDLLSEWRLFLRPSRTYVAAPTMGQRAASTPQALQLVGARTTMPPSEHRKGNTCQNGRHTFVRSFVRSPSLFRRFTLPPPEATSRYGLCFSTISIFVRRRNFVWQNCNVCSLDVT